jgi:hypothetical protein
MATKYADRAFISVNGARISDVESAELKQNNNAKIVPTMTTDNFNRGFVQGNRDIDVTLTIALQNKLARPALENIDYEAADVQLTFISGIQQWVCTGLFLKDVTDSSPGVGEEVKTTYNFSAIKIADSTGNGVLFNISLPSILQ